MTNQEFITAIAGYVEKYAYVYGILVHSPIIAQAILESGWGESKLAATYHNYFGLKCGTKWTGKSVNLTTQEEYEPGTLTTIKDNFRVYDSMEEGVKGYFEFIQLERYQNLRGITDPGTYLETIWNDGYATSSTYVENNMKLIEQYDLTQYDGKDGAIMGVTAQNVLDVMRSWIGYSEANGKFKQIIDLYNSHKPLARGYAVQYDDEWCDTTVSAAGIKANAVDLIGTECGCEEHVKIFKNKGIWIEDGTITPQPGDIIVYNWDDATQPNDGYSDHIGYVESVSGSTITVIEGNKGEAVGRRSIQVGWGYIRGYARPKYASGETGSTTPSSGGSSSTGSSSGSGSSSSAPNKTVQWTGTVTADALNVRTWAGTENGTCSFSPLKNGAEVGVCDSVKANDGSTWYYIKYNNKYGFVHSAYVTKKTSGSTSSGSGSSSKKVDYAQSYNKSLAGTYKVTASDGLNLRTGAGTGKTKITAMPKGATCQCYGYYTSVSGVKWLLVVYKGQEGFASSQYLQK